MSDFDAKKMRAFATSIKKKNDESSSSAAITVVAPPSPKPTKEIVKEPTENKEARAGQVLIRKKNQLAVIEILNKRSKIDGQDAEKKKRVVGIEDSDLFILL